MSGLRTSGGKLCSHARMTYFPAEYEGGAVSVARAVGRTAAGWAVAAATGDAAAGLAVMASSSDLLYLVGAGQSRLPALPEEFNPLRYYAHTTLVQTMQQLLLYAGEMVDTGHQERALEVLRFRVALAEVMSVPFPEVECAHCFIQQHVRDRLMVESLRAAWIHLLPGWDILVEDFVQDLSLMSLGVPFYAEDGAHEWVTFPVIADRLAQMAQVPAFHQGGAFSAPVVRCRRKVGLFMSPSLVRVEQLTEQLFSDTFAHLGSAIKVVAVAGLALALLRAQYQGREANATEGLVPKGWLRTDQKFDPGLPPPSLGATFTKEDILECVRQSVCHVAYDTTGDAGYAMVVSQNCILMPTHYVSSAVGVRYGGILTVTMAGVTVYVQLTTLNCKLLANDPEGCVVRVGGLPGCVGILGKMWAADSLDLQSLDEVTVVHRDNLGTTTVNSRISTSNATQWRLGHDLVTAFGDCGAVYIGRHNTSWKIFAMHFQILGGGLQWPMGFITTQHYVKAAISLTGGVYQGVVNAVSQVHRDPSTIRMNPFPVKSEVWAAMSSGARVVGYGEVYPPLAGSTVKTNILRSLIHDDVKDWEEEFCGMRDYWCLPEFRGKMVDGVWTSPYTESFSAQNNGNPDELCLWLAVADYLSGCQHLLVEGWRPISEQESVVGIPGSYIHSVNMRTSVGPPFNQGKRLHMLVYEATAYCSPELLTIKDEIDRLLETAIPAPFAVCTLKDEPVKIGKMPRVFSCLSAAFNMVLKQHLSPIKSFMRANRDFFESFVGVDMTSKESGAVVDQLKRLDSSLTRLSDEDAKKLDKAYSGILFDFVALAWYGIAFVLGHPHADSVELLILALKHTRFCIKGDIFNVHWNPSGHDATVEVNGALMSLCQRYVFYRTFDHGVSEEEVRQYAEHFRENPIAPFWRKLVFREKVALVTYGDDVVKSLHPSYSMPSNYLTIWRDELGIEVTDAAKTATMTEKCIDDIQFLKRKFVWSDRYKRYLTPLDLKSMMRTLLMKKESVLSLRDHTCVAMSEVLREAVYHGEVVYQRFFDRFQELIAKYELGGNAYLRVFPFSHWDDQLMAGTFVAWEPRGPENPSSHPTTQDVQSSDC